MYPALNASPWIKGRARWAMCIPHGSWKLSSRPITQSFAHFYFYFFFFFFFHLRTKLRSPSSPEMYHVSLPHSPVRQRADGTGAAYLPRGTSPHGPDPSHRSPHSLSVSGRCPTRGAQLQALRGCCGDRAHHVIIHGGNRSPLPADGQWSRTRSGSCRCRGRCTEARAAGSAAGDGLLRVRRSL